MQFDQFIGHVQNRARLEGSGAAVAAIRAALGTLGERLAGGAADNLASELPREIGEYLRNASDAPGADPFSLNDFFDRVSQREPMDLPAAIYHARVVMEVLQEAVSPGAIAKVRAQLPDEWAPLFEAGSAGELKRRH